MIDNYSVKFGRFAITPTTAEKLLNAGTPYLITFSKVYKLNVYQTNTENRFEFYAEPLTPISGSGFGKRGTYVATNDAGVNSSVGYKILREDL